MMTPRPRGDPLMQVSSAFRATKVPSLGVQRRGASERRREHLDHSGHLILTPGTRASLTTMHRSDQRRTASTPRSPASVRRAGARALGHEDFAWQPPELAALADTPRGSRAPSPAFLGGSARLR